MTIDFILGGNKDTLVVFRSKPLYFADEPSNLNEGNSKQIKKFTNMSKLKTKKYLCTIVGGFK